MIGWNVYLNGKWIDTVFYTADCDRDYVKDSLINHDGYYPNIVVKKDK